MRYSIVFPSLLYQVPRLSGVLASGWVLSKSFVRRGVPRPAGINVMNQLVFLVNCGGLWSTGFKYFKCESWHWLITSAWSRKTMSLGLGKCQKRSQSFRNSTRCGFELQRYKKRNKTKVRGKTKTHWASKQREHDGGKNTGYAFPVPVSI